MVTPAVLKLVKMPTLIVSYVIVTEIAKLLQLLPRRLLLQQQRLQQQRLQHQQYLVLKIAITSSEAVMLIAKVI